MTIKQCDTGKMGYTTRTEAQENAYKLKRQGGDPKKPYACKSCGMWHIGGYHETVKIVDYLREVRNGYDGGQLILVSVYGNYRQAISVSRDGRVEYNEAQYPNVDDAVCAALSRIHGLAHRIEQDSLTKVMKQQDTMRVCEREVDKIKGV